MNFNEKLIELRKSKHLSQEELGNELGVSRQTISKWELAQSYPDFQRLVLLSDYYGLSLDELVHDLDVQDVREKNLDAVQLNSIYNDVGRAKKWIRWWIAIVGIAIGIVVLLILYFTINAIFFW
ncbi:helix-turn-helix domain-containing protein [Adlercreutzia sp. ZJ473]|uniref:helix-turn-helix domain-containing protein n=1 Tax=Adlercreutzia sp. ZJ473 TaxID=2722822 RepID=UPI00155495FF|nr:helix-turn-helix transcriptional regulator [Adlercreutzia sp. ZJ473]